MNNFTWMAFSRSAISAAVAIVVAAPVLAQNTTSAINGRVVGADGKAVAGATVAILHTESGSLVTVTSDSEGRYAARGLRVGGPYTITISKAGQSEKREGVTLALAETLSLDATLGSSPIVITGQAISDKFNRSSMGAGTNIGSRELASGASIQRNLQDYARTDPRVSQSDKERGEIAVAGQNSRYNSITIDGVKINDTFGLESNNLPTLKQPISIDAIQSVQVNISNYDVTQKGYTGANINAVTKSGTNEIKGSVYYVYRDESLSGFRYNRTNDSLFAPAPFIEATKGFTVSGPILQDKLFFFAGYEELKSTRAQPDFGPLGTAKTNVGISQPFINNVVSTAKSKYGVDLGSFATAGAELTVKDTLLKLDWNISDDHRASIRYSKTEQSEPIFTNYTSTSLSLSSNWYAQNKTIDTIVAQWFADWTPTFSTELKYSRRNYDSVPENGSTLPQIQFAVTGNLPAGASAATGTRTLFTGTERSRHFNVLTTKTDDVYAGANWTLGDHELKFGADLSKNQIYNAFLQDTYGNYTFRCVNSSSSYTYTTITGAVTCTDPAQVEAAILENFNRGRPFSYQAQVPLTGKTLADGVAQWTLTETGLFLQDNWNVNKELTLTGGVRVDTQSTNERPIFNAKASAAPTVNATTGRAEGGFGIRNDETVDGASLVQPRFGFNWNLGGKERRMQVRGGFGLFQGAAASVWLGNPFSNTGAAVQTVGCGITGFPACDVNGNQFTTDAANPQTFSGTPGASNVDFLQAGLNQPSVWKANLAFETELPWYGVVASAEWLYTKNKAGLYYKNLNLGAPTTTGKDGRAIYWNAQGRNAACFSSTGGTITTGTTCTGLSARSLANLGFNSVTLAAETNKGSGNALTLSLSQPSRDGLSWGAAYTRTAATEVSPLTSSVAFSNWRSQASLNNGDDVAYNSASLVKDRFSANLSFSKPLFDDKLRTTLGVFYEGRKGRPYSWTFRNDINGDGQSGNDLMYIPSGPGSGEVQFTGLGEDAFWAVVSANKGLNSARGSVVKRNSSYSPFVNTFDMRVSQEVPGFTSKHKGVITLDLLNVGNLLNSKWGRTDEMAFSSDGGMRRTFVNYGGLTADGRYIYNVQSLDDYTTKQVKGESQWAAQITVRYEF